MSSVSELAEITRRLPNGDLILGSGWISAGFGRHRDSDRLAESNFEAAKQELADLIDLDCGLIGDIGRPWEDGEPYDLPIGIAHFRHWAVGWIDELVVRSDAPKLLAHAVAMVARVDQYPVLNEADYAEREYFASAESDDTEEILL